MATFSLPKKRQKMNPPTADELNYLREAEAMFHSNLFKMQVDELMTELNGKIPDAKIRKSLEKMKQHIYNIPETTQASIIGFTLGEAVEIPILQTPPSIKGMFKFVPPTVIKEVGSFALDTMCSPTPTVDIAVEIPKECWQSMDFRNHQYHRKRAFYIAYIAYSLLDADFVNDMKFCYQDECHLKPALLIRPKGLENVTVCLTAYPNISAFKSSRFLSSKNNVRTSWFFGTVEDSEQPTPYYNATVLSDMLLPALNDYLKKAISSQSIKDGIILLKLWCFKRGLMKGHGRLNGFILTMFVAYLMKKRKISPLMSSYQVFRCALLGFRNEDFIEKGITLCDSTVENTELGDLHSLYRVVFLEMSGIFNICYAVSKETLLMVQHEARLGLLILEKESLQSFFNLFIDEITFTKKFEYLLCFKSHKKFKKYLKQLNLQSEQLDFGENICISVLPKICDILKRGLDKRVLLIDIVKDPLPKWPISESPPNPNLGQVQIGFLLNHEVSLSNIEKGPVADDPKAKDFRNFWGEKSELRRFQDGTIREAVFWPAATAADRRKVFTTMITDILKRHIDADSNHFDIYGIEIDNVLEIPQAILSEDLPAYGTGEETHAAIMKSFDSLCKEIRVLIREPLGISSIQGVSSAFRFSEVFPAIPMMHIKDKKSTFVKGHILNLKEHAVGIPPYTPALKAIITLEGSGKWADDIEAIKRVKAAFHIQIAQQLKLQLCVPFMTHIDIFKDGFVFRFEIACHKEIFLLKQIRTANGSMKIQDNKESRSLELAINILPKLNSILHGLHQQHNTYGTACRLAKRWISSQLKHGFIDDITVELLVAFIYIHPEPYTCPCSPQVAFIRFLSLLINHDWAVAPLIVNLNNELKTEEISEINTTFTSQRSTLPSMVIVTPFDKRGSLWTKNKPAALILKRIIILAEASLKTLNDMLTGSMACDFKAIFRPPLDSYDILIHLKRDEIPRLRCAVDVYVTDNLPKCKPYKHEKNEVYPIVEYDPVQKYLEELRENFGEFAFFLHDIYGGDFIAVIWKRSVFTPKEFKVSQVHCRTLYGDGSKVIPDVERILEDFKLLGSGIVKDIVKQTENWQIP